MGNIVRSIRLLSLPLSALSTLITLYLPTIIVLTLFKKYYLLESGFFTYIIGYTCGAVLLSYYIYSLILEPEIENMSQIGKIIAYSGIIITSLQWMPIGIEAIESFFSLDFYYSEETVNNLFLGFMYLVPVGVLLQNLDRENSTTEPLFSNLSNLNEDDFESSEFLKSKVVSQIKQKANNHVISRNLVELADRPEMLTTVLLVLIPMGISTWLGKVIFTTEMGMKVIPIYVILDFLIFLGVAFIYKIHFDNNGLE